MPASCGSGAPSPDERLAVRQERSVPVLNRIENYLREQQSGTLPKSQYGQAIAYTLNHWDQLLRYTEDGRLEIDNNFTERTLRLCAISRNDAQFPIMQSSSQTRMARCVQADALLCIIRRVPPGIEAKPIAGRSR
jgi:hypothetical protein